MTSNLEEVEMDSRGLHFRARQANLSQSDYGVPRIHRYLSRDWASLEARLDFAYVDYVTRHVLTLSPI